MNRKIGIGGSECAAVLGLSKWKTPYQVYLDKLSTENLREENEAMYWGNELEPLIVKKYQNVTGNEIQIILDEKGNQKTWISKKYPWLMAHVDGIVKNKPLLLEAKSTRYFSDKWGEDGSDKIPIEYLLQCAHYCIVLGETKDVAGVDIAALGSTNDFRIYRYNRNETIEKKIIERTEKFWNENVLAQVPPEPGYGDDLAKIYSYVSKGIVLAPAELQECHKELVSIKMQLKSLEEQEEHLKKTLQLVMQDKDTLIDNSGVVLATWKAQETTRLDQKRLKESGIDLSSYYNTTSTRRFLVK